MIECYDECVGCTGMGLHCIGAGCPNRNVPHFYCDNCHNEFAPEELYDVDDDMLCTDCLLNKFDTVAQHLDKWYDDE